MRNLCTVGTINNLGTTNLAVFNSLVHIGANPPMAAIIIRPDSVDRHTLQNIRSSGCFTVNNVLASFYQQAHQTSGRYANDISEFDATGLTPLFREGFMAPFVKESTLQLTFQLVQEVPIVINGTIMVIGALQSAHLPEAIVASDGFVDHLAAGSVHVAGVDAYYDSTPLARLTYAKPNTEPQTLKQPWKVLRKKTCPPKYALPVAGHLPGGKNGRGIGRM